MADFTVSGVLAFDSLQIYLRPDRNRPRAPRADPRPGEVGRLHIKRMRYAVFVFPAERKSSACGLALFTPHVHLHRDFPRDMPGGYNARDYHFSRESRRAP